MNSVRRQVATSLIVGVMTLAALAGPLGQGAGAAVPAGAGGAQKVAGSYTLYFDWDGQGWSSAEFALALNGTGSDVQGDRISWSKVGRSVTISFIRGRVVATYHGTRTKKGLSSHHTPGAMANTAGHSGVWYASKTS